jgi:hypothetical protein
MNAFAMSLESQSDSLPTRPETAFAIAAVMLGNRPVRELSTLVNWSNAKGFQAVKCQPWGCLEGTNGPTSIVASEVQRAVAGEDSSLAAAQVATPESPAPKPAEAAVVPESVASPALQSATEMERSEPVVAVPEVVATVVSPAPEMGSAVPDTASTPTRAESSAPVVAAPVVAAPVVAAPVVAAPVVAAPVVAAPVVAAPVGAAPVEELEVIAPVKEKPIATVLIAESSPGSGMPEEQSVSTVRSEPESALKSNANRNRLNELESVAHDEGHRQVAARETKPIQTHSTTPVASKKQETFNMPSITDVRRSSSKASDDYVQQLEQLVIELNYELGRINAPKEAESESPTEWLVNRMLNLNLQNMALKEQLRQTTRIQEAI